MNLYNKHITVLLSLCAAFAACNDELNDATNPDAGKTPIELKVGGIDSANGLVTRASSSAVITENVVDKMIAFPENTNIFMIMQSEYDTDHADFTDPDDPHKRRTTIARGTVSKNGSAVSFDNINKRYWDDAHARSSQLTIWAFAQMYKTNWTECKFQKDKGSGTGWDKWEDAPYNTSTTSYDWTHDEVYPGIKSWSVSHNANGYHDTTSVLCQDLLFSNNIANNNDYSKGDNRLKFNFSDKHFPTNNQMYFRHAMSKITIHIKKGNGYKSSDSFAFTSGNVTLKDFNTQGAFNIKEGEFQYIWNHNDIPQIYLHGTPDDGDTFTLEALAIPNIHQFMKTQSDGNGGYLQDVYSRFVSNGTNVMMEFTIEGNKYQISSKQLYNALHVDNNPASALVTNATELTDNGTYIPLEAGKHYHFTMTIGKTAIENITAKLADWEVVTATDFSPSNARIEIEVEDDRGAEEGGIDFYRAHDDASSVTDTWEHYAWETGYTESGNKAGSTYNSETKKYTLDTEWYWDSNMTYYHFRTVQPANHTVTPGSTDGGDYITLAASQTGEYTDVKWGAPFKDLAENPKAKFKYSLATGFDINMGEKNQHQIYKAIGPTLEKITIIPFHMMSDVTIKLRTTTGNDKVSLENATVKLVGAYTEGKVLMGNGRVVVTGERTTEDATNSSINFKEKEDSKYIYKYGAIPQDLQDVTLVIQTSDHNRYIVPLKDLSTQDIPDTSQIEFPYAEGKTEGPYFIDKWHPDFKYIYELELTKTGINNFRATIINWEEVVIDQGGIQIQ